MAAISGKALGDELCRALGLDSVKEKITRIEIICALDGLAVVKIERLEFDDSGVRTVKVMEQYNLVMKEE